MNSNIKYDKTGELIEKAIRKSNEGDRKSAIVIYEKILKKKPNHLDANYFLGTIDAEDGNLERAKQLLKRAAQIEPSSPYIQNNLGNVYKQTSQLNEAIACFKRALENKSDFIEAHLNLGLMYKLSGDPDNAIKHYDIAKKINPNLSISEAKTASVLEQKGDYKKAYKQVNKLLKKGDKSFETINAFSSIILHGEFKETELKRAIALIDEIIKNEELLKSIPLGERSKLFHTLGNLLDKAGNYKEAFNAFKTGYDLQPKQYDVNIIRTQVNRLIEIFSPDFIKKMPSYKGRGKNLVFIVGMPRSGSTLIEQILASHNNVTSLGETGYIESIILDNSQTVKRMNEVNFKARLAEKELSKIYSIFSEKINYDDKSTTIFTDKTLDNYLYMGYIAQLFPEARIINCLRDPLDTCLSCYFTGQWDMAYDLHSLGVHYRQYERLMEHWFNCLPLKMVSIKYEDLIEQPKKMTKEILDFCELKWSRKCLKFYKNKRFVTTASYHQVRKPIYSSSINRHKNYINFLGPLQEGLNS